MFVGMARADFLIPASTSLKDKRRVIKSLGSGIRSKFSVAVAEVDYQDLRNRGALGLSCVSESSFQTKKVLNEVERFMRLRAEIEVLDFEVEVVRPDDA